MSETMFEQDEYVQVRLPWAVICKLAVRARSTNVSFNGLCEMAIREHVCIAAQPSPQPSGSPVNTTLKEKT